MAHLALVLEDGSDILCKRDGVRRDRQTPGNHDRE